MFILMMQLCGAAESDPSLAVLRLCHRACSWTGGLGACSVWGLAVGAFSVSGGLLWGLAPGLERYRSERFEAVSVGGVNVTSGRCSVNLLVGTDSWCS